MCISTNCPGIVGSMPRRLLDNYAGPPRGLEQRFLLYWKLRVSQRSSPSWSVKLVSLGSLIKLSAVPIMGLITPNSSSVIPPRFWMRKVWGLEGLSNFMAISSGSNMTKRMLDWLFSTSGLVSGIQQGLSVRVKYSTRHHWHISEFLPVNYCKGCLG